MVQRFHQSAGTLKTAIPERMTMFQEDERQPQSIPPNSHKMPNAPLYGLGGLIAVLALLFFYSY
jgi:hypothetical protein